MRDVDVGGQEVGDQDVGGENADVVVGDKSPDLPVGAVDNSASGQDGHGDNG